MSRFLVNATWDDAPHLTQRQKNDLWASIPEHERDARAKGIPVLGSGRIFPIAEEDIACDIIKTPREWPHIGGMDFGWDHPFGAVDLAWDREADIIYVTKTFRKQHITPVLGTAALKPWGVWLPWSWPRDGRRETQEGAGEPLAAQFREQGLEMLPEHAQFDDKSVSVEAGLMAMLDRMQTGRWKVFRHLSDWFEEFRLYHREDGKVVKERDDLMAASRYAFMMLRYAIVEPQPRKKVARQMAWDA